MKKIQDLKVQIFADGADKAGMLEMYAKPYIKGLTTNPTLMKKVASPTTVLFAKTFSPPSKTDHCHLRFSLTTSQRWSAKRWKLQAGVAMCT